MQQYRLIIILILITIALTLISPKSVKGLGLVQWTEVPADFSFSDVWLDDINPSVKGGSGKIVIKQLLSLSLIENWEVTVQAPPFSQVNGNKTISNSLKLNSPISHDERITIVGGPWDVKESPITIIRGNTKLGKATNYEVNFGIDAFSLFIDPGLIYLEHGQTSAQYTTTITWTLTNPVL
jgi:hypothetical protein